MNFAAWPPIHMLATWLPVLVIAIIIINVHEPRLLRKYSAIVCGIQYSHHIQFSLSLCKSRIFDKENNSPIITVSYYIDDLFSTILACTPNNLLYENNMLHTCYTWYCIYLTFNNNNVIITGIPITIMLLGGS